MAQVGEQQFLNSETVGVGVGFSWARTTGEPASCGPLGASCLLAWGAPLLGPLEGREPMTAKSLDTGSGDALVSARACFCFTAWRIWVLSFPLQRPTICTKCFTLLSVKNLLFFQIFYKFIHPWKPDIPYFILLRGCHCEGCGFTCNRPLLALISLTATNCKWRTNERNIYKFHGNSGGA